MCSLTSDKKSIGETEMQRIDGIVNELKTIMQDGSISVTSIVNALGEKCSRNTILTFFKGDSDCKLSTLLMILDACNADLRIDTERSRESILSGDIASYRNDIEQLRKQLDALSEEKDYLSTRYDEVIAKNAQLTTTVEKQQATIERYMSRMEKSENAIYDALENIRRKDARIVELSRECNKW